MTNACKYFIYLNLSCCGWKKITYNLYEQQIFTSQHSKLQSQKLKQSYHEKHFKHKISCIGHKNIKSFLKATETFLF